MYGRGMRRILELGSEYFPLALCAEPLGRSPYQHRNPQLGRTLGVGWLLEAEVNAVWGGQRAQESQSMVLGPIPDSHRLAAELQRELFRAVVEHLTPGRDLADLTEHVDALGERHGLRPTVRLQSADRKDSLRGTRVEANTVWACHTRVSSGDARLVLTWGTSLLVTDGGAAQFVDRQPDLVSTE